MVIEGAQCLTALRAECLRRASEELQQSSLLAYRSEKLCKPLDRESKTRTTEEGKRRKRSPKVVVFGFVVSCTSIDELIDA